MYVWGILTGSQQMHAGQPDSSHCMMRSVEKTDWRSSRLPGDATVFGSTVVITKVSSNVFKNANPTVLFGSLEWTLTLVLVFYIAFGSLRNRGIRRHSHLLERLHTYVRLSESPEIA